MHRRIYPMTTTVPMPTGDTTAVPSTKPIHAPVSFVRDPEADLRRACAELLLAGSLLLSDVQRESSSWNSSSQAKASEDRFRKALEVGREALS